MFYFPLSSFSMLRAGLGPERRSQKAEDRPLTAADVKSIPAAREERAKTKKRHTRAKELKKEFAAHAEGGAETIKRARAHDPERSDPAGEEWSEK